MSQPNSTEVMPNALISLALRSSTKKYTYRKSFRFRLPNLLKASYLHAFFFMLSFFLSLSGDYRVIGDCFESISFY